MPIISMRIIPEPEKGTRSVLVPSATAVPVIKGSGAGAGDPSYSCGSCGLVLVETVQADSIVNFVFRCPKCRAYSEV